MFNKLYITTTLPYVNAEPHIAHAIEFVLADAIARYYKTKLGSENVYFSLGTDEHGQKIWDKSQAENIEVHEFTTKYANRFKEFCKLIKVDYSFFYRTSESYHYPVAQAFWNEAMKNGDIYKKRYSGLYCVGCESFKLEKDLIDGKCPDHGVEPVVYEEENYFFKLSKYKDEIAKHLQTHPVLSEHPSQEGNEKGDFVIPEAAKNFAIEFIKNVEDISISRDKSKLSWGIPIPGDDNQVMYVWFDALSNYIGSLFYGDNSLKIKNSINEKNATNEKSYPEFDIKKASEIRDNYYFLQLCGDDNIRFQSIIWQGMLASCGIKFTDKLLVHSWILGSDGRKMSKTLGNVVSPFDQLKKYGAEALRFFILACLPTTGTVVYDESGFIDQYNSRVADNYGNLLNRVVTLIVKNGINVTNSINANDYENSELLNQVNELKSEAEKSFEEYNVSEYCAKVSEISTLVNKYITDSEPWKKDKTQEFKTEVLTTCYKALRIITELYKPILPDTAAKAKDMLDNLQPGVLVQKIERNS